MNGDFLAKTLRKLNFWRERDNVFGGHTDGVAGGRRRPLYMLKYLYVPGSYNMDLFFKDS